MCTLIFLWYFNDIEAQNEQRTKLPSQYMALVLFEKAALHHALENTQARIRSKATQASESRV